MAQLPDVGRALAARAILRALPLIATASATFDGAAFRSVIVLPYFRFAFDIWRGVAYPFGRRQSSMGTIQALDVAVRAASRAFRQTDADPAADTAVLATRLAARAARGEFGGSCTEFASKIAFGMEAFLADAVLVDQGKTPRQRALRAGRLALKPLWLNEEATWHVSLWGRLRTGLIEAKEGWELWIKWYEDRISGRNRGPDDGIARATLSDLLWKAAPAEVNAEILRLIRITPSATDDLAGPIPAQQAGLHFALASSGKIGLAPAEEFDGEGNHVGRIRQLLPLIRRAGEDLIGRLNRNAFPELARDVTDYLGAIAGDETRIAWGVVFGLGVMLENSAEAARRNIEDRLQPPLEDSAEAGLNSLLTLHGPLILATTEGRELADEADRMRLTREEQAALREDAEAVAAELSRATELVEAPAAEMVGRAANAIGRGPHPERATVFGIRAVRNMTVGLVGMAAIWVAFGLNLVEAGAILVGVEALKKSERFSSITSILGQHIDRAFRIGPAYRQFVIANEEPLRRIAANAPQLRWMVPHIDRIIQQGRARGSNRKPP